MIFYRGLESFVHSVLSEEGHEYMQRFSRLFEQHVVTEARKVPARFVDEDALREFIEADTQVPDGLFSFPGCNVFIEAKAGLYHESAMTVGNRDVFAHKTKAIRTAVGQAWATSVSLRKQRRAPLEVLDADAGYLLIVSNKELGASKGSGEIELPAFLASCVRDDEGPQTALHLFEQHLNRRKIPMRFSSMVEEAIEASLLRLERALGK